MRPAIRPSKLITIISITIITLLILVLAYKYLSPFGKITSYSLPLKIPGLMSATTFPPNNNSELKLPSQIIRTEISRFSLNLTPGSIKDIQVKIKFKDNPKELKVGLRGNEKDNYLYRPLYNSSLANLSWFKIEEPSVTLWQKDKKYKTVSDFLNDTKKPGVVGSYLIGIDDLPAGTDQGSSGQGKNIVIDAGIRGSQKLLIQVARSPLVIKISKQDLNWYEGEDKLVLQVQKKGEILTEKTIGDDGTTGAAYLMMQPQESTLSLENVKPGTYLLNLINPGKGSDVLIKRIEINQSKAVAVDRAYLMGSKPTTVWTKSGTIYTDTYDHTPNQQVNINGQKSLQITNSKFSYEINLDQNGTSTGDVLSSVEFAKNDLVVKSGGYFSFTSDSYFDPETSGFADIKDIDNLESLDYIISKRIQANREGEWITAETAFRADEIGKIDGGKLYFSLEIPELNKFGGELELGELDIKVTSNGLLEPGSQKESIAAKQTPNTTNFITPIQNSISRITNFFAALLGNVSNWVTNLAKNPTKSPPPSPVTKISPVTPKPTSTPVNSIKASTSSPTTAPTLAPSTNTVIVKVLNGGAISGAASKFVETLKTSGYINASAGNIESQTYKNASLRYRSVDKSAASQIASMLTKDYLIINREEGSTTSAEIIVILGSK